MLKNRRLFATAVRDYSWLFVTILSLVKPGLHHERMQSWVHEYHTPRVGMKGKQS